LSPRIALPFAKLARGFRRLVSDVLFKVLNQ
jgi:hypothetical protein